MASIRTARVIAAVAALPLMAAFFSGTAAADDGSFAGDGSNAASASVTGSGVGIGNTGNSATTQQQAVGTGASNSSNAAQVKDSAFTVVDQSSRSLAVNFTKLW